MTLAHAVNKYGKENVVTLTFNYGQRHSKEMEAAAKLSEHYDVEHVVFDIDLWKIGGSALTDLGEKVPEFEKDEDVWKKEHVALTYVPMRNTIFISIAAAFAEVLDIAEIWTGFNFIDSGGYPDTRPEYLAMANRLLALGSAKQPVVKAPLMMSTKRQIVLDGEVLKVPWEHTWSCYEGKDTPCGKCNACVQRAKGFNEANVKDPLLEG